MLKYQHLIINFVALQQAQPEIKKASNSESSKGSRQEASTKTSPPLTRKRAGALVVEPAQAKQESSNESQPTPDKSGSTTPRRR